MYIFPAAEYGSVSCDGVPLAEIPSELTESRVFQLRLANNGMRRFPDAKLSGSGEIFSFFYSVDFCVIMGHLQAAQNIFLILELLPGLAG